jgi:AraC family transcriptional regulator
MSTAAPPQYFGGDLRSYRTHSGLRFSEVDYGVRKWAPHSHLRAFFAFLLRGRYVESVDRRQLAYRPFDLGFHPEGTQHADEIAAGDTRFFLIELDPSWLERLRDCAPAEGLAPRLCAPGDARVASRLYREHREEGSGSRLMAEGLVLELLGGLLPEPRPRRQAPPRWLSRALDLLESEYPRKISLDVLAREVGLHPVYLSRAFRELTGRSLTQHVLAARIRFAARKLSEPGTSISDIALAAGFADQSHFTRVFKRETGLTPAAFRNPPESLCASGGPTPRRKALGCGRTRRQP